MIAQLDWLNGTQIVKETVYTGTAESYTLVYLYDENGAPIGMRYRTPAMAANTFQNFFFEKNLQGDIVAVYNETGTKVISYTYDAWGRVVETVHSSTGTNAYAQYNPFRYRGYYYDTEVELTDMGLTPLGESEDKFHQNNQKIDLNGIKQRTSLMISDKRLRRKRRSDRDAVPHAGDGGEHFPKLLL